MERRHKIVLCGNSLLMAGVQATLSAKQDLDVIHLNATLREAEPQLHSLDPAVVIFEMAAVDSEFFVPFLTQYPSVRFVGLDATRNVVTMFSSERLLELSFDDLAQVIRKETVNARLFKPQT